MDLLRPVVRPYAWGSRTAIAELQGRPVPAPGPEAELWMGAHPSAPSGAERAGSTLDAMIAADPDAELGPECAASFGGRLPFLLKVLSAAKALSIQVHPSRAQAEAGYLAENQRGLAPGDPARNYVDDWPKPELLYALTPFEMVAGLRTPADAAGLLRALAVDELQPLAAELSAAASEQAMAGALASVLERLEPSRAGLVAGLVAEVVGACAKLAAPGSEVSPYADACAAAVRVAADHPGDLGVVALLLMRHVVLQPGQAVFMPAGGLHAYLRGTGIELLANSDNVVRAGLTGKHIDVPELLKLLDPAVSVPVLAPRVLPDGIAWFDTPAPEFRLYLLDLTGPALALPGRGPRILLCAEGACVLRAEPAVAPAPPRGTPPRGTPPRGAPPRGAPPRGSLVHPPRGALLDLNRGGSCFISAADGPVQAAGHARLV
ncbi:MAG: mannose-6-phosphate isomerase, class I, partial [Streptosporangiaceae bacterium]